MMPDPRSSEAKGFVSLTKVLDEEVLASGSRKIFSTKPMGILSRRNKKTSRHRGVQKLDTYKTEYESLKNFSFSTFIFASHSGREKNGNFWQSIDRFYECRFRVWIYGVRWKGNSLAWLGLLRQMSRKPCLLKTQLFFSWLHNPLGIKKQFDWQNLRFNKFLSMKDYFLKSMASIPIPSIQQKDLIQAIHDLFIQLSINLMEPEKSLAKSSNILQKNCRISRLNIPRDGKGIWPRVLWRNGLWEVMILSLFPIKVNGDLKSAIQQTNNEITKSGALIFETNSYEIPQIYGRNLGPSLDSMLLLDP